jgi:signal transduction histidine kinase
MKSQPPVFDSKSNDAKKPDVGKPLKTSSFAASSRRAMTMLDLDIDTIQWLSDDLGEGFALFDPEDRLVVANPEYLRLHNSVTDILKPGITFETMFRAMVRRGVVNDAVGDEETFIAARVQQHQNPVAPVLRRLADGRAYIIKETRLPDGTVLCRENDVTELVSAKEALHESEERFKSLAEIASDWFWETDEHYRLTSMTESQRMSAMIVQGILGRTRWEFVGADPVNDPHWAKHKADLDARRPFKDFLYTFVPPTGMSTHFRVSGSAVFNKAGLAIGYRTMPKDDGGRRHFSVSGVPVFDRNGRFTGYRGTSREITKEILTERRAALAHQRLLDAIEAMPESVLLCDAEDRVVLCNSATYTRLPWCKTLIEPGMKFEDVLHDIAFTGKVTEARGREDAWIRENLERHRAADGARQYRHIDGRWVEITERKTADGGTVVIRADITEKKRRELEREAALTQTREENRAKSTFMATFTHEVRTPVSIIMRMAGKLRRGRGKTPLTAAQKKAVQSIEQAAEQALRLVDDVLDIARIQVRRYAFKPQDIDVAALVRDCCDEAAGKAGGGAGIAVEIAPDLGVVHADEGAVRRVILSVIDNAFRVERDRNKVRVTADPVEDGVEIAVHDNGAMLSDADIAILMRPFEYTAAEAASARTQSFGFGLAVASALAVEIGGILSIMCPSEGGTRVVLRMPRAASR